MMMKAQNVTGVNDYIRFACRYQVACMFPSIFLKYMAYACGLLVDVSLAWRMARIDSGLPSLSISWIAMMIVGLFSLLCFWLVLIFP